MPKISDFEKKHGKKTVQKNDSTENTLAKGRPQAINEQLKRRPGRDSSQEKAKVVMQDNQTKIKVIDVEKTMNENTQAETNVNPTQVPPQGPAAEVKTESKKIEINFPGSEMIRSKFPKPFELAEAVATDWMKDGQFDSLPVSHPLMKTVAQQGLLKAKEIEKKVIASPVTEKVAMQAMTYAMKAQTLFNEVKTKVKTKVKKKS